MKTIIEKFAFDTTQTPPVYCNQGFVVADGDLYHTIDGTVRAQVPGHAVVEYLISPNVAQALTEKETVAILEEFSAVSGG